jgi:hypothetical protein
MLLAWVLSQKSFFFHIGARDGQFIYNCVVVRFGMVTVPVYYAVGAILRPSVALCHAVHVHHTHLIRQVIASSQSNRVCSHQPTIYEKCKKQNHLFVQSTRKLIEQFPQQADRQVTPSLTRYPVEVREECRRRVRTEPFSI